jgi:DNA end-binding protein Ku
MWKASLRLGRLAVPVKLYAAVSEQKVHFRLLHAEDRVPVQQQMVDPRSGEEVAGDEVRRGVELEDGRYVLLSDEELEGFEPEASREIEVLRCVPADAIDVAWYARPYWLGPDGASADYFALARALAASGRRGVARWVMRGRRHFGALAAHGEHLALISLHDASEVIPAGELARPAGKPITAGERKLAEQLVATLDADFDPAELRDEHRERVRALVKAKAAGRRFTPKEAPAPRESGDLAAALRKSLGAAKGRGRAAA